MADVRPIGTEYRILTSCEDPDTGQKAMVFMAYRVVEHVLSGDGVIEMVEPVGKPVPAEDKTPSSLESALMDEMADAKEIERMQALMDQTYSHIDHCTERETDAMKSGNLSAAHHESQLFCNLLESYFGILNVFNNGLGEQEEM